MDAASSLMIAACLMASCPSCEHTQAVPLANIAWRVVFQCIHRFDTAREPQLRAKLRTCQQTYLTHAKHERSLLDVGPSCSIRVWPGTSRKQHARRLHDRLHSEALVREKTWDESAVVLVPCMTT